MWDNQYVVWRGTKQLHIEKLEFVQIIPLNWGVSYHFDRYSRTIYPVPIKLIWRAPTRWYYLHKPSFVCYVTITYSSLFVWCSLTVFGHLIFTLLCQSMSSWYNVICSHFDGVRALAFHPVEPVLITGSEDHTLKLWNLQKTVPAKK